LGNDRNRDDQGVFMNPAPLPLFDFVPARRNDPGTSKDAARSINTTPLEAAVYGCLKAHGPKTSFEIADILRLSLVTVSPRLRPLADKCLVRDSGVRRLGKSGRNQIVWEIVP
jgi:DNA-binding CsgD family transcriptional regulator